jgi:hypothetical protein
MQAYRKLTAPRIVSEAPARPALCRRRVKVNRNGRYATILPSRVQTVRWP